MVDIFDSKNGRIKVGLYGLGKSNLGVLELLRSRASAFELTLRSDDPISADVGADRCFFGRSAMDFIDEDIIFLSPSVRRDCPQLIRARDRGTVISSDTELFLSQFHGPLYAVTGSDGKSTTTYLISQMLTLSGVPATAAGNYGRSLAALIDTDAAVVAELSSFQLQYTEPASHSAVITNITPNHLNWHTSLDEYVGAKMNIKKHADRLTADLDGELLRTALQSDRLFAAVSTKLSYPEISAACDAENYLTYKGGTVYLNGSPYFSAADAKRREEYNVKNYMRAAAATLGEAHPSAITEVINGFGGLPHRAERIASDGGITYINSSIDSTPERTLKTLGALNGRIAVIICGEGKGLPLDTLAHKLPSLTVGAALMGPIGRELYGLLARDEGGYRFAYADGMAEAITLCESYLNGAGTVVLSPAATSFDRYKNFEHRGTDFKGAVAAHLKSKHKG